MVMLILSDNLMDLGSPWIQTSGPCGEPGVDIEELVCKCAVTLCSGSRVRISVYSEFVSLGLGAGSVSA